MFKTQEEINDAIDAWHNSDATQPIHEYLGLTLEEYSQFVESSKINYKKAEDSDLSKLSNETLATTIASCMHLKYNNDLQVKCMIELSNRRNAGDDYPYEDRIDQIIKEFEPIDFGIKYSNPLSLLMKGITK